MDQPEPDYPTPNEQRIIDLERMLLIVADELSVLINRENERLKSNIRSTDLDEPDYLDHQTVHEALNVLSKQK